MTQRPYLKNICEVLSLEKLGELFQVIDNQPTGKLSELAKIAGLNLFEDYIGADLSDEDLSEDNLAGANLSNANLSNANLSNTNLSNTNLSNANLHKANLCSAVLKNADLSYADLSYADLSYADLSYANLFSANLDNVNLSNANLSDVNYSNSLESSLGVEGIFQLLYKELQESTKASKQNCHDVASRITTEVYRICQESKRIQASGDIQSSAIFLARHRLQQCFRYYQLGLSRSRVELHSTLSAIIYRYINPPQWQLSYQGRLTIIEDFLQGFYLEALNAFRRENQLGPTYRPQTLLELSEYMAFTERYGKRRIPLPGRQQQLIILRAQTFSQQQPPETNVDIEQASEGSSNEGDSSWEEPAVQRLRTAMATQPAPEPEEDTLRSVVITELMDYLEQRQQSDCAYYFSLRLQDMSDQEIENVLGLTPRQRDYLQERFKYHLIRFALLHRWELVHEWLEASLHTNLGLTPQQWQYYTAQLDDKQRSLLELKQQGQPDEKIAQTLGLSTTQLQKRWFKILEQAWEIRNWIYPL